MTIWSLIFFISCYVMDRVQHPLCPWPLPKYSSLSFVFFLLCHCKDALTYWWSTHAPIIKILICPFYSLNSLKICQCRTENAAKKGGRNTLPRFFWGLGKNTNFDPWNPPPYWNRKNKSSSKCLEWYIITIGAKFVKLGSTCSFLTIDASFQIICKVFGK